SGKDSPKIFWLNKPKSEAKEVKAEIAKKKADNEAKEPAVAGKKRRPSSMELPQSAVPGKEDVVQLRMKRNPELWDGANLQNRFSLLPNRRGSQSMWQGWTLEQLLSDQPAHWGLLKDPFRLGDLEQSRRL